jgi:beta-aspartyl-peptidase (threonine type)
MPFTCHYLLLLMCLGTWADKRCAVSGTGIGEEFLRRAAAHDVAARVAYKGIDLSAAVKEVVFGSFAPGDGGFIGVDDEYNIVMEFNTVGMYRAAADSTGRFEAAIFKD